MSGAPLRLGGAMAAEWAITETFSVGRFKCTVTGGPAGMTVEWVPAVPDKLNKKEWKQYRNGRDGIMSRVAERMGGSVLILETGHA